MKKLLFFAIAIPTLLAGSLRAQDDRPRHPDRRQWMGQISVIVRDCDLRATEFRSALARALDRSRLDGTRAEDRLNEHAKRLDVAIHRLRESWNREHDPERSREHVREAVAAAREINWAIETDQVRGRVQHEWDRLRAELSLLAGAFDEPQIRWDREHARDDRSPPPDRREWIGQISGVVQDCDQRATEFRSALARALDRSRLDGTRAEDRLNEQARRLDVAISRLRESWNRERDPERSREHVREAVAAAREINWAIETHQVRGRVQHEWDVLRAEVNRLAEVFHEPQIHWER
jgi:hypothetical protein